MIETAKIPYGSWKKMNAAAYAVYPPCSRPARTITISSPIWFTATYSELPRGASRPIGPDGGVPPVRTPVAIGTPAVAATATSAKVIAATPAVVPMASRYRSPWSVRPRSARPGRGSRRRSGTSRSPRGCSGSGRTSASPNRRWALSRPVMMPAPRPYSTICGRNHRRKNVARRRAASASAPANRAVYRSMIHGRGQDRDDGDRAADRRGQGEDDARDAATPPPAPWVSATRRTPARRPRR